jgi:hypothetical protein
MKGMCVKYLGGGEEDVFGGGSGNLSVASQLADEIKILRQEKSGPLTIGNIGMGH